MGDVQETKADEKGLVTKVETTPDASTSMVLTGTEKQREGKTHFGIAVEITSDGKASTLMIPDVVGVTEGDQPIFLTKRIGLNGMNLDKFLDAKGVILPPNIKKLIEDTEISCEAFYYTKNGPLLMMFEVKITDGLIKNLTKDDDLGNLFDIKSAAVRVFRCEEKEFDLLRQYAAGLEG